jgi:ABC-type dipeptide/oligopeptide/nickel transport system permease component
MISKLLNITFKSLFTTLLIGYIIFNITYIRNNCPVTANIFEICSQFDLDESFDNRSIVKDQLTIMYNYLKWLSNAIFLDFGVFSETDSREVFKYAWNSFVLSFSLIFFSLTIGLLLSILFIVLSRNEKIKDYIVDPFLSFSFIHLGIFAVFFRFSLVDNSLLSVITICLITAIGSGILFDFYTLLDNEHNFIMSKDYVIFARNSGYNEYNFAFKELFISIIYISTSRIPILFGGMIMIEVLSKSVYEGIGFAIWLNLYKEINYNVFFGTTFLCITIFTFLYFLTENIKSSLVNK